jgi:hypothetical protein
VETAEAVVETAALESAAEAVKAAEAVETAEALESAAEAVKAAEALESAAEAAKEDCFSEEWVALAAHNLEDGCAPLAI